jgi:hypothetical protein
MTPESWQKNNRVRCVKLEVVKRPEFEEKLCVEQDTNSDSGYKDYPFAVEVAHIDISQDEFATPEVSERVEYEMRVAAEKNIDEIKRGNVINEDYNPGLDHILSKAPQIAEWRKLIKISPSLALEPFYYPGSRLLRPGRPAEQSALDYLTDQQLGVALRNRAKIERVNLSSIFEKSLKVADSLPEGLIMAAGRGRTPIISAVDTIMEHNVSPRLTLLDIDRHALETAEYIAQDTGFTDLITIDRDIMQINGFQKENPVDVLKRSFIKGKMAKISLQSIPKGYFNVATLIGITPYIPDDNWNFKYNKKLLGRTISGEAPKAGVQQLLSNIYDHVKLGGQVIFDVINPDLASGRYSPDDKGQSIEAWCNLPRKRRYQEIGGRFLQLYITDMMGWDKMRTVPEVAVLDMIEKTGINTDKVTIMRDPTGFFSFYSIHKQ